MGAKDECILSINTPHLFESYLAESSNESHSDCICTGRDILEKQECTQALSAFYDYFSDAPAEG